MPSFPRINFPGALPLAPHSGRHTRPGACRVCPALPPPICSRRKPAPPREPPRGCGRHPLPQESSSLRALGLEGVRWARALSRGSLGTLYRRTQVGAEGDERIGGGSGGCARGLERECRRQAPRRHLLIGSHSEPKCPFPRPAAAERRGCGIGGAGGGTCSWRPSPGGGQTWLVRRVPNFSGDWLRPVD